MTRHKIHYLKENKYIYFISKVCVFYLLVFILDFIIGHGLNYLYFKQESGFQNRITYAIEKTTEDIIIIGSSRAKHHYVPDILEQQIHQTCYNAGNNGQHIFYYEAIIKSTLKRYNPKMIILDFKFEEFSKNNDSYDRLSAILPYYKTHPELRPIIKLRSPYEKMKLLSNIYPYNSSILTIFAGNMSFNKKRKTDLKGYVPLNNTLKKSINKNSSFVKYDLDSLKIKSYESIIKECIDKKIKLSIICSPYFIKANNTECSIITGKQIAKKYNIPFYDYSQDSIFIGNISLFNDETHLNNKGAKLFSSLIINKFKHNTIEYK